MKFYTLTSNSLEGLQRNIEIIPSEDLVVVINTLDNGYQKSAESYCKSKNVEYFITESDGTPATGKNSVLKLFLESEEDYMVHVDGDDFITPYGYRLYKSLSEHPSPPDMVVLYKQPAMKTGLKLDYILDVSKDLSVISTKDKLKSGLEFPTDKSHPIYESHYYETYLDHFIKFNHTMFTCHQWSMDRVEFDKAMLMYSDAKEYMCRMVFHSRKIAEHMQYDNSIMVGEDTIQFLKLKRRALDGEFDIHRRRENKLPSYMVTKNKNSITNVQNNDGIDWSWIRPFLDVLDTMKDELPEPYRNLLEFIDDTYT